MRVEDRIKYLSSMDLFQQFTEGELYQFFAENVCEIEVMAGEILCREGGSGDDMYILLVGELKISKDNKFITTIKPVEYIGEMALIEDKPRSATVEAITNSTLLKITRDQFQEYFSRQPESLFAILQTLSRRIRLNTEIIAEELEKANIMIHDMKNQMAPFLFLDMLEKKIADEPSLRMIKFMRGGRDNLTDMMAESLARAKRVNNTRKVGNFSIQELIADIRESEVKSHPDLRNRLVEFHLKEDVPEFNFCRLEIRRVLVNLLVNASQASASTDLIEVGLDSSEDNATIYIMDRGEGVPEEIKDRIFDSCFTTREGGNGLGLASCRYIVETLHFGKLGFAPREGGGSIFTFTLALDANS
ncbi:MAG: cyclic nucleotide-binding domain-containing protein [Desulfobulbaceae bacterium]|nr:cyclic nucleotide-binding domain-containing protein [Desulfobulbaceae bacterium]